MRQKVWLVVDYEGEIDRINTALVEKESVLSETRTLTVLQDERETSTIRLQEPQIEHLQGGVKLLK